MRPPSRLYIHLYMSRRSGTSAVTSNTVLPPSRSVPVLNETNLSRLRLVFYQAERELP